ncbi:hypothetical protein [Haloarchaeobius salinus]|uniref:hypothetical protein n=1 Tax=Haloarchaeobius salinus TaxID=1198298 RepID=UPI00210E5D46|nr:hypothetical protein [Haloarchaeobius salinus]
MGDDSTAAGPDGGDGDASAPLPEPDPETVAFLREVAEEIRADSSESEQLANILYRTSDIYDADEETTPEDVVRNVKFILEVKERGGLGR